MMRPISRRTLLGYAGAGLLGLTGLPRITVAAAADTTLRGRLLGISTQDPEDPSTELSSVVSLDLASGEVSYSALPHHRLGHSLLPLPDGGYFAVPFGDDDVGCLFLGPDLQTRSEIRAPAGHGFGGHAVLLPDGRHLLGHFNRSGYNQKHAIGDTGALFVVDIARREVVRSMPSTILHGHDMILTRDGRHVIVGDDGTLDIMTGEDLKQAEDPFALEPGTPQLVVFDAGSLEPVRQIPLAINGALVHIVEGSEGRVFGAVEQFVANDESGLNALRLQLGEDVALYVDHLDESVVKMGIELPYPGPLVRVDPVSGDVDEQLAPFNQMPFDIALNAATGRVFNIFVMSHMLARWDPLKQSWGFFSTKVYDIERPYSVVDIPGTTMMAVNGFNEGIAVFDALSMGRIAHFDTRNYGIKHLLYQPVNLHKD